MSVFSTINPAPLRFSLGIVKIGDPASGQAAKDAGIICLPVAIVTLADDGIGQRVEHTRAHAAGAFVEIARILFQERRKYCTADECAGDEVGVGRAVAFGVALRTLAVPAGSVGSLLNACDGSGDCKVDWINGAAPGELKFLFGVREERHWERS